MEEEETKDEVIEGKYVNGIARVSYFPIKGWSQSKPKSITEDTKPQKKV